MHAERKALQIHNLYIVISRAQKISPTYAVVTDTAALVGSQCGKWGIPSINALGKYGKCIKNLQ
jgi:hypothetical protein